MPTATAKQNAWLIRRDFNGSTIIVSAQYIPALEIWGMTCKANGTLVDHRQADAPFETALKMIEHATLNLDTADTSVAINGSQQPLPRPS
jgi:hypothetical protein